VIGPTGAVRVLVATRPVDFRKGAEGLAVLVREQMQADPFSGAFYVFRAKRADSVPVIEVKFVPLSTYDELATVYAVKLTSNLEVVA
jgi:IS66 Orf2 like protein